MKEKIVPSSATEYPKEAKRGRTFGVLTVSDNVYAGKSKDESGPFLIEALEKLGFENREQAVVSDEVHLIEGQLKDWCQKDIDLIVTTGGTGLAKRDVTPEATLKVIDRFIPGISEALRLQGLKNTPNAMLSRAVSGFAGNTLIINLPGSLNAVRKGMEVLSPVLHHAIDMLEGKGH